MDKKYGSMKRIINREIKTVVSGNSFKQLIEAVNCLKTYAFGKERMKDKNKTRRVEPNGRYNMNY